MRGRASVAGLAALATTLVLFVQDLIGNVTFVMIGYLQHVETGMDVWQLWISIANGLLVVVAFGLGVWLCLWRLAPVTGELEPVAVVLRGALAAALGAALVFLVHLSSNLAWAMHGVGSLVGNSFPELPWGNIGQAVGMSFQASLVYAFLEQAPVVVLVALLVWIRLRRYPSRHPLSADTTGV